MTPLGRKIHKLLVKGYHQNQLDASLTLPMLPGLAQALETPLERYIARYAALPEPPLLWAIVNNFVQDGPLVQAMLNYNRPESAALWREMHTNLTRYTQWKWPHIGSAYQDKIIGEAYIRIYRNLPGFLFKSRLKTWVFIILKNEFLRIKAEIDTNLKQRLYLYDPDKREFQVKDRLSSNRPAPLETVARQQAIDDFWERLNNLRDDLDVKILRLHIEGYNQLEIQQKIGYARSNSAISRRISRLTEFIRTDEAIQEIVQRLDLLRSNSYRG